MNVMICKAFIGINLFCFRFWFGNENIGCCGKYFDFIFLKIGFLQKMQTNPIFVTLFPELQHVIWVNTWTLTFWCNAIRCVQTWVSQVFGIGGNTSHSPKNTSHT